MRLAACNRTSSNRRAALGAGQQRTARQLSDAAESLARDRMAERIREGKQALNDNNLEGARANERAIERSLNNLSERLQSAEQGAGRPGQRAPKRRLIGPANLRTTLIHCAAVWMKTRRDVTEIRTGQQQGQQQGQQGQQQGQQGHSKGSRDNKASSKVSKGSARRPTRWATGRSKRGNTIRPHRAVMAVNTMGQPGGGDGDWGDESPAWFRATRASPGRAKFASRIGYDRRTGGTLE